ncbi:MAG: phage terminase large subunit [Novosphingobium sp.]|nr:phage terminase large subunit [Novosphingobium sp.]MCP5403801.1 phage terminase large subunit [Novosphingobium sp.]
MTQLPRDLHDAMTRADYAMFVSRVMSTLEPGTRYEHNWHIDLIAHRLEGVRSGERRRLMINLPPRSMKTILVSVAFSAWLLGHDPTRRIMCVAYNQDVAKAQAVLFWRIVNSPWFRRVFPQCRPTVPNRQMEWQTSAGGYRLATSIEGSVLGRGADFIILDDPNKGQQIYSKVAREKVKTSYDHTISTRLNHPRESAILCVMQRLHDDDLAGHMLNQEDFEIVRVPAIALEDEVWDLGNGQIHRRASGELLQPSRMGPAEIERQRAKMGNTAFNAQYQQQPVPDDGIVIRRSWLRYYEQPRDDYMLRIASWDTASTLSEEADWSVGTVWGLADQELHLLHVERVRLEAPELVELIEDVHQRYRVDATLIEDADFGRGIAQHLFRTSRICRPQLYRPRIDKIARMQARSVMFETGKVFLPREASWLSAYLDELLGFPNRAHDDQVDSTSQALDWFQARFSAEIAPEVEERRRRRPSGRRRPRRRGRS